MSMNARHTCLYVILTLIILISATISWVAYTCPRSTSHFRRSPLIITSKVANKSQPTIWLGVFGSCSRANDVSRIYCLDAVPHPFSLQREYDHSLSVLPSEAPHYILQLPHWSLRVLAATATIFQTLFVVLLSVITLIHHYLRLEEGANINKFLLQFQTWAVNLSIFLLYFGITSTAVTHLYFESTRQHFNAIIDHQGGPELDLVASIQQGYFAMVYCGFGLISIPLLGIAVDMWSPTRTIAVNRRNDVVSAAKSFGGKVAEASGVVVEWVVAIPAFCGYPRG